MRRERSLGMDLEENSEGRGGRVEMGDAALDLEGAYER